ncbi:hypothetical protein LCGC14_0686000 [marine sediment metagenome]|uniref:Uncharacterized protein n=1 Tax=marine sediment metagenome TaxID=412755 RepID=A0A0F9R758_9ZZZZ
MSDYISKVGTAVAKSLHKEAGMSETKHTPFREALKQAVLRARNWPEDHKPISESMDSIAFGVAKAIPSKTLRLICWKHWMLSAPLAFRLKKMFGLK